MSAPAIEAKGPKTDFEKRDDLIKEWDDYSEMSLVCKTVGYVALSALAGAIFGLVTRNPYHAVATGSAVFAWCASKESISILQSKRIISYKTAEILSAGADFVRDLGFTLYSVYTLAVPKIIATITFSVGAVINFFECKDKVTLLSI